MERRIALKVKLEMEICPRLIRSEPFDGSRGVSDCCKGLGEQRRLMLCRMERIGKCRRAVCVCSCLRQISSRHRHPGQARESIDLFASVGDADVGLELALSVVGPPELERKARYGRVLPQASAKPESR